MAERREPTIDEIGAAREVVEAHYTRRPRDRQVMSLLFDQYGDGKNARALQASEIGKAIGLTAKDVKGAMRQRLGRLREELYSFFRRGEGRRLPWHVAIARTRYILEFQRSDTENSGDYVGRFWEPYRNGGSERVRVIYAEPQFFRDAQNTYFRNRDATDPDHNAAFAYLNLGSVKPTSSFVQAGVVRAMLDLFACFEELRIPCTASPTRWGQTMSDQPHRENLIVLGTGSSNPLIGTLEDDLPYRTRTNGVELTNGGRPAMYQDENQEDLSGTKYALLTRTPHRVKGRVITILTAEHGRTVQALAEFLTSGDALRRLAAEFGDGAPFPISFQALFRVEMVETTAEPYIQSIEPVEVISIRR